MKCNVSLAVSNGAALMKPTPKLVAVGRRQLTLDVVVTVGYLAILVDRVVRAGPRHVEVGLDSHICGSCVEVAGVGWFDGCGLADGVEEVLLEHIVEVRGSCFSMNPAMPAPPRENVSES